MTAPEFGVRFELVLEEHEDARAVYQGFAFTADARYPIVVVSELDATKATIGGAERPANAEALEKNAAALVRAATKAELRAGEAVPRKIVRWRAL